MEILSHWGVSVCVREKKFNLSVCLSLSLSLSLSVCVRVYHTDRRHKVITLCYSI